MTIADEGQISRAAAKLKISQPTLSQAMSQLEAHVGFRLFERNARGVSLTPAGAEFLPKARAVLATEHDVEQEAQALKRASQRRLEVGFIGPPPTMTAPALFGAFTEAHPDSEVSLRDLPFPSGTTESWLSSVDVAFCHPPAASDVVRVHPLRAEPRAVIAPADHPLAQRQEVSVSEVLDETFISYHPDVQADWAGFHSLDDHRGGPPSSVTDDQAATSMQMFAIMTTCGAITTIPLCDGRLVAQAVAELSAIPLRDAHPAMLSLVWHSASTNRLVGELVRIAGDLVDV